MQLTSPHNPRLKHLLKLRERKHREREGLMLVEGYEELSLALASGARPQTLFICPALIRNASETSRLTEQCREVFEVPASVFAKVAYRENPDGWLAVFPMPRRALADLALPTNPLLLITEAIEKPGNLGAMLRSADAAGAHALIVCDPTTDVYNPNVVRASKGTVFTVPVVETTSATALAWLTEHRIALIAATPQAHQLYTHADMRGPVAIAVGTEKDGLSAAWLQHAGITVRLPMHGQVNSLNVATAAALMMYEAVRQRTESEQSTVNREQ